MVKADIPDEAALTIDLRATYPGLHVRPVREFGGTWKDSTGVWTGGEACMPDGLPIFDSLQNGCDDGYDGGVHEGFSKWLEDRAWYMECEDYGTYMIIPILAAQWDMTEEQRQNVATGSDHAMRDQYNEKVTTTSGFAGDLGRLRPVLTPVPDSEMPF